MTRCYNLGEITCFQEQAGGIAGYINQASSTSYGKITYCYNAGDIYGTKIIGGILGGLGGKYGMTEVSHCYNKGKIQESQAYSSIIAYRVSADGNSTLNNLYYLNTVNVPAIIGSDDEENNIMAVADDLKTYEEFVEWIKNK